MKIIDFEKFGNAVKFYLGDDSAQAYLGDDWDDIPYELNAGPVYEDWVTGTRVIYFDYEDVVLEPCESNYNEWSKLDMKNGDIPCIIRIPREVVKECDYELVFDRFASSNNPSIDTPPCRSF